MPAISVSKFSSPVLISSFSSSTSVNAVKVSSFFPVYLSKSRLCSRTLTPSRRKTLILSKSAEAELSAAEEEWIKKLPDKKKPLYSHSLPCIEAWLKKLGFYQSKENRAVWLIEKTDWNAQLSLDVTDLYIRYLKTGPGDLEKDVERRFSYALSREDIENAMLGGP